MRASLKTCASLKLSLQSSSLQPFAFLLPLYFVSCDETIITNVAEKYFKNILLRDLHLLSYAQCVHTIV
jgi:hypothetical protein